MSEILNVAEKPFSDDEIIKKDYYTYRSYISSFKNSDEIKITIQNTDLYVLPSESYIYIEGHITLESGVKSKNVKLRKNFAAQLFDEIRYELNGVEIDRTRYLGISSTIKNYVSLNQFESSMMRNAGWANDLIMDTFNFCIPLRLLLGFAEDFNKVILNSKHDLILLRSSSDANAYYSTDATEKLLLTITNLTWRVPHIKLSDSARIKVMKIINEGKSLPIAFRSWECHFNPTFTNTKNSWALKLSTHTERARFILFVFEKDRKFVHCDLTNMKAYLNSESYPYDDLKLNFKDNRYAILYEMYANFQKNYYYNTKECNPLLSCEKFVENPIVVIDVSHQNETVKSGPIDVKIEFETSTPIPENTSAYCLILHDRLLEYTPLSGTVRKIM